MKPPIIFRILESEECAGTLAPYILSSGIHTLVESMYSKNKDLFDMMNSLPDEIIRGSITRAFKHLPYDGIVESHYTGNSNPCGDAVISGALLSSDNNNLYSSVLPPHKVNYDNSLTNPRYESNIYNPCLRDAGYKGVFQTGSYPREVETYSSDNSSTTTLSNISQNPNEKESYIVTRMLQDILDSSIESIVNLQIQNILTALIQADKLPVKYPIVSGLKAILETISIVAENKPSALISISRFGLYTETSRNILSPMKINTVRPFICIDTNVGYSEYIKDVLSSTLKSYSNIVEVSILSNTQFETVHSSCPIDLDFECSRSVGLESPVDTFNMILSDINKFRPDVFLTIRVPSCVKPLFPGNQIAIPYGSSGKLTFIINDFDEFDINGIELNGRFYSIDSLTNDNPSPNDSFRGIGLISMKASLHVIDNQSLLELNYIGIMNNINISILPIRVLDRVECEIEDMEVTYSLSEMQILELSFDNTITASSNGTCSCITRNNTISDSEVTTDNTSQTENDVNGKRYHLTVTIPFTNHIASIRRPDDIIVHKVIRSFDDSGKCISFKHEDVTDKFNKTLSGSLKNTLVACNKVSVETIIDDKSEYIITFNRGSLFTTTKVLTETLPAVNSEDVLHFAIDPIGRVFSLLEDTVDNYPEWIVPSKSDETIQEDTTNTNEPSSSEDNSIEGVVPEGSDNNEPDSDEITGDNNETEITES